ncbi:hypothetical protein ACHAQA_008504 [Verticillium albo-atrum]
MKLHAAATTAIAAFATLAAALNGTVTTPSDLPVDLNGSNFTYPYPISLFSFTSQATPLEMAFLDVAPRKPRHDPAPVAVLLHGKNFCGATWELTIKTLSRAGYRVIAPDQIGFCKSSKPTGYQFSFSQLALNTRDLLAALDITSNVTVVGHSLGGMLATRFALQHPAVVSRLVLVNPIGLEDYIAKGVPYPAIDTTVLQERTQAYTTIRAYQQAVYYLGVWKPAYDVWVTMLAAIYWGSQRDAFVWCQARVVDMVFTQPVAGDFEQVKTKSVLLIGEKDTTAIGKASAPKEVQETLGKYNVLGKEVASRIPGADYIGFEEMGHSPHIENPEKFHKALLKWLKRND